LDSFNLCSTVHRQDVEVNQIPRRKFGSGFLADGLLLWIMFSFEGSIRRIGPTEVQPGARTVNRSCVTAGRSTPKLRPQHDAAGTL